jgi:hypothetical protein
MIKSIFAVLAFLASVLVTGVAIAAETTTVTLQPLVDVGFQLAVAVAMAVVPFFAGWIAVRINSVLGLKIDAQHRAVIEQGLVRAVNYGIEFARTKLPTTTAVDVKSAVVAQAVNYAMASVPDALKHFDITPERLRTMIESRISTDPASA